MVNKKQELIEAIDKLQESQVVKFNNRVVDLNMSLHRHELRLILKEDYQDWNDNAIDALFESLLNEDSDYDRLMKTKVSYTPEGSDKPRQVQVRTALKKRADGTDHPAKPPASAFLKKKGLTPDQIEKAAKKEKDDNKDDKKSKTEDLVSKFQKDRESIIKGLKSSPGTGGSMIGEMFGGISAEEAAANPKMTEEEFIEKHFEDVRNSPISKGMTDKQIKVWMGVAYRTGKNEIKELESNKKYNYKNPQPEGFPLGIMDPVNEKGASKKQLNDMFEQKLAACGDDKKCKAHYKRQLKFMKKRKDTDTGILYVTNEGHVAFKHTSNKKGWTDPLFNSSIRARGRVIETTSKDVASDYGLSDEQSKNIGKSINTIIDKGASQVEKAAEGPGAAIRESEINPRDFSKKNQCGKLFSNLGAGQSGRKNYLNDIKKEMESGKGVGKKVNKWFEKNGIEPPYSDDDIAAAVLGIAKDGDNTTPVRKLVVKLSDNVKKARDVYKSLKEKYPDKSEEEIKKLTVERLNSLKNQEGDDAPTEFDEETVDAMLSEDMDWLENVGAESRDSMEIAHKQIVTDLGTADDKFREENPDSPPQPPDNGPHTQAYVDGWMRQMHLDRYIYGDEEDIGDMSIDGHNVNSKMIRECLKDLSGFEGDTDTPEGRDALYNHLRARLRPDADGPSISLDSKEGEKPVQIGKEVYRTKGVGVNSVMGHFGKDFGNCLKNKSGAAK